MWHGLVMFRGLGCLRFGAFGIRDSEVYSKVLKCRNFRRSLNGTGVFITFVRSLKPASKQAIPPAL